MTSREDVVRLKAVVEDPDELPEALRAHYAEDADGRHVLAVEPVDGRALEDVEGLKSALGKERRRAEAAEGRLKAFGDVDPEAARRALAAVAELGEGDPAQAVEARVAERLRAREAELEEAHAGALAEREGEIERLTAELEREIVDAAAARALAEHGGAVELLLPHVRARTRARHGEDGRFAVEVIDADGRPRIGDARGAPMTVAQLVAEMKAAPGFARAFDGSGQSGGGTPAGGANGAARRVSMADQAALDGNLQAIARGEVTVTD